MAKQKTEKEKGKAENAKSEKQIEIVAGMLVGTRGRVFYGYVTKKFPKRVVIEFERTVYLQKYERFYKKKTRLHARLPDSIVGIEVGDYVKVMECRPLRKLIHFVVVEKVKAEMPAKEEMKK
jgi:small subunit ribosomal protein S17